LVSKVILILKFGPLDCQHVQPFERYQKLGIEGF